VRRTKRQRELEKVESGYEEAATRNKAKCQSIGLSFFVSVRLLLFLELKVL